MCEAKNWLIFDDPSEVMPNNDLMDHDHGLACLCKPRLDGGVIVHNAYDMREDDEDAADPAKMGNREAKAP